MKELREPVSRYTCTRWLFACLAVLLLGALVYAQLAALTPAHQHHSASDQCAICHAGHMRVVSAPALLRPEPAAVFVAATAPDALGLVPSRQADRQASRAPPLHLLSL